MVSIQLVSPTSGDSYLSPRLLAKQSKPCFHSISFPNEWGGVKSFLQDPIWSFVSIQLVSPTSGENLWTFYTQKLLQSLLDVSIQLVSPTSGEFGECANEWWMRDYSVSIQLVSPTSGEIRSGIIGLFIILFPFN